MVEHWRGYVQRWNKETRLIIIIIVIFIIINIIINENLQKHK